MTRVICQETERWSKDPVLTMVIYCCGDHSEHASEPFTLLKSVLHKAHLHLELTCSYEHIYWVDITTSAHGHT